MKIFKMADLVAAVFGIVLVLGLTRLANARQDANDRWMKAAIHMIVDTKDYKVSTTDQARAELITEWALENGYTVEISHWDGWRNKPEMFFLVLTPGATTLTFEPLP
jgi:hypothetical protein